MLPAISSVIRTRLASSLSSKADHFLLAGQKDDAIAAFKDVIHRFEGASERPVRKIVARALKRVAGLYLERHRYEETIETCNAIIERFGTAVNLDVREELFSAFERKALALYRLDRKEEALVAHSEWLARYGATIDPDEQEQIAFAFAAKASLLTKLGRTEQAIAAYDDLLARFGTATQEKIRALRAAAEKQRRRLKGGAAPDQATSLIDLSVRQFDQGDHVAALRSVSQATSILREMNGATSGVFQKDLALALTQESHCAYACGDPHTGLRTLEEAADICRALTADRSISRMTFAHSLQLLAKHYDEAGYAEKALAANKEALVTLSTHPRPRPAEFSTQLITTWEMYFTRSEDLKREPDEALVLQVVNALALIGGKAEEKSNRFCSYRVVDYD
jgi:hypothetical protein